MGKLSSRRKAAASRNEPVHSTAEWKQNLIKKSDADLCALQAQHDFELRTSEELKVKEIEEIHEYYANMIDELKKTAKLQADGLHSKISEQSQSIVSIKNWCEIVLRNQIEQAAFTAFQLDAGRLIGVFSEAEERRISENFGLDDCKLNYNKLVDRCHLE